MSMKEISYEMAKDMGLLPDSLTKAFKAVEGSYIFSPATERAFEDVYKESEVENRKVRFVLWEGEKLEIV